MENLIKRMSDEFSDYLRDESRKTGHAKTISFPKTEGEIASIAAHMYEEETMVTVQGARTGLAAGAVPANGHIINLSRMNKVMDISHENDAFYIAVQPGLALSELRKIIASKKMDTTNFGEKAMAAYTDFCRAGAQFFPSDPTEASASIGGMVNCNASGARSFYYGSVRNYIHKLRIVLINGDILVLERGKTFANGRNATLKTENGNEITLDLPKYTMPKVKNASGYFAEDNMDLIDLFIGSDGTLGIISEIELKLLPLPQIVWGCIAFFKKENMAIDYVQAVRAEKSAVLPVAIEFFNAEALEILRQEKANNSAFAQIHNIPKEFQAAVYCEISGNQEEEIMRRLLEMGDICEACGGSGDDTWVARNTNDLNKLMFFRHAIPECVNMIIDERHKKDETITKLGTDMSVPDCELENIMQIYRMNLEKEKLQFAIWGHIGNNHLHVNIMPRTAEEYKRGHELYEKWAKYVSKCGGAVSAEHGVGKLKTDFLEIMYGAEGVAEMRRVKQKLDAKMLLNRGNMFDCEGTK